ncbi:MAG TPA: DUF1566 domain-containing protein [Candidatus Binatia bacterium]|jgi:hypothetical protein
MRKIAAILVFALAVAFDAPAAWSGNIGPVCGDVNHSGNLTATDALAVLRASVGQPVKLDCPPPGGPLVTGITDCVDPDAGEIACSGTSGQDGDLQNGVRHNYIDNGDGTISDPATGLMWEKLANDSSTHDMDNVYTWSNAYLKIGGLNSDTTDGFAGHKDWRLPNIKELEALSDLDVASPAVAPGFRTACPAGCTVTECSCTAFDDYWSSSPFFGAVEAWTVTAFGTTTHHSMDASFRVRAVRTL